MAYLKLQNADWSKPNDIKSTFGSADLVTCSKGHNRVVLNVGGNKYRLILGYFFSENTTSLFVKFVGTHQEYDKVDACKVNMF